MLFADKAGQIIYVDGHMIASWSRRSMHKGKIIMLGRIMAGSQGVIAHDETGQGVFVAYSPPDIQMSQVIVAYCRKVAQATGSVVFVIDRAVNAVALAGAFDDKDLGVLCMLETTSMRVSGASRPPWWTPWTMGQRCRAGGGKRAAKMIPGTW